METASTNQTLPQHSSFKSYYVVWKRKKYGMTQENKKV